MQGLPDIKDAVIGVDIKKTNQYPSIFIKPHY